MRTSNTLRLASLIGALVVAVAPVRADALQAVSTISPVALADSARTAEAPRTAAPRSAWNGVFRVQLSLGTKDAAPAALVVERVMDELSGFMLVDTRSVSLSGIRIEGDVFRARVTTAQGNGELTLRIVGDAVSGTLKVGKQTWDVVGQRSA